MSDAMARSAMGLICRITLLRVNGAACRANAVNSARDVLGVNRGTIDARTVDASRTAAPIVGPNRFPNARAPSPRECHRANVVTRAIADPAMLATAMATK